MEDEELKGVKEGLVENLIAIRNIAEEYIDKINKARSSAEAMGLVFEYVERMKTLEKEK